MNLHEYQAKQLLSKFGVPILKGYLAYTPHEAQKAAVNLGGPVCVVKAQVHAGGRGKAGGVKLAKSPEEARDAADSILGMTLVTPQTGEEGKLVRKVWVEDGAAIKSEYYLSILIDRAEGCYSIVACAEGGTEIEEIAETNPEKILTVHVRPESGLLGFHTRSVASFLGLSGKPAKAFSKVLAQLFTAAQELDTSMLEINPLIQTEDDSFIALDAKMAIDDNALFRQRDSFAFMDFDEIDEREIVANQLGISYVALDGNIGCMVNGAGLAMGTMDIIKQAGGEPANFLDVGGGATKEMVMGAFDLILRDPKVKGVLVNIFGGIMRCDIIAEGIIAAAKELSITVPLVVRLRGTNVEKGKELLANSGLSIIPADWMDDAAQKIVEAVQ
jgi:succinyl-CoA synthetase beta subunit